MGVTITVALAVWAASSLIEYKIVSASPRLKFFFHGVPGIIISLAIGWIMSIPLGVANGAAFTLGQVLGIATNEWTFKAYSTLAKLNAKKNATFGKVNHYKTEHPKLFAEATNTIKLGFKTIAGVILAIIYIIGIPARIIKAIHQIIPRKAIAS